MHVELPQAAPDTAPAASWRLTDLIDVDALQSIQDTFARAFGLPTVIVHPDGSNATAITHRLRFCEDLTRTSAVAGPRCAECDMHAMADAAATAEPRIFKCWNGLYDCAIPIAPKGRVLGYFLCGQTFTEAPDPDRYRQSAAAIGVDPGEYVDALEEVKVVPLERYQASVQSMHVLAQMIADQAAASIDSLRMLEDARRAKEDTARLVAELDGILEGLRDVGSQPDYPSTLRAIVANLARLIPWDSCVIYLLDRDSDQLVPELVRDPYPDAIGAFQPRVGHGVIGRVAQSGVGRRFADVSRDADFEPVPGVPVEPESALVVPMVYNDTVSGVITLSRFDRRTFTDHELSVLSVFSSQASVSIQVARLASASAERLREERAFGHLLRAMTRRTQLDTMLTEVAAAGAELLEADSAVVVERTPQQAPRIGRAGLAADDARVLADGLEAELDAVADGEPRTIQRDGLTLLLVPLAPGDGSAVAVFARRRPDAWDVRLARAFAAQASLGIDKARMLERERRLLLEYQRLAELGTELVKARDADDVRERLVTKTPGIVGGDVCFIALLDPAHDGVELELREGRHSQRRALKLDRGGRVAALRLRDEPANRALFDAWGQEVFDAVTAGTPARTFMAEPLSVPKGMLGGLFVGWHDAGVEPSPEQRRVLSVLAGAAGTSLARFATYMATDSSLHQRVVELEALTQLANRITGLTHETPILDELIDAFRQVGGLDGVVYGLRDADGGVRIVRSSGVDGDALALLRDAMERAEPSASGARSDLGDGRQALVVPVVCAGGGDDALLAGIGPAAADGGGDRDRVMATLARYGSVALENALLHDRQREAISRLERTNVETAEQYDRLERILSVHETLGLAVLEGRGLASVARSLGGLLEGELVVVDAQGRTIATSAGGRDVDWRPAERERAGARSVVSSAGDRHFVAAPARLDGELLAWVVARLSAPAGDVERAAVEYAALLTAFDLLRERTALEIETRLRGGFLEDLFGDDLVPELLIRQGLLFGFDLLRPARVYLVEAVDPVVDAEALFGPVSQFARSYAERPVVAMRGSAVVALLHEPQAAPEGGAPATPPPPFEDALLRTLRTRLPGQRFTIGAGTVCRELGDYRRSYLAARRGVDLLRRLGRSDTVFSFRDSTVATMLLQSSDPDAVLGFVGRYVTPLDDYDRAHTSSLRQTVEAYFAAARNLEATARALHIHVSTLRYRLRKVSDLIGIDLKDGDSALDLQVALRAATVLAVQP